MTGKVDFNAEGLLEGLDGDARAQRVDLLQELHDDGADLDELKAATQEGRLPLLAVERGFVDDDRYTSEEVADLSGVDREVLEAQWRALGMVVGDEDERSLTGDDLEAAKRVKAFMDAGLSSEAILEVARVMAMATSQVAAANRQTVINLFAAQGAEVGEFTEVESARWLRGMTEILIPMVGPALEHVYRLQLREQLRHAAVADDIGSAQGPAAGEMMAIGFADMVGFTRLGEQLPPEEFGRISARLGELASEVAHGPVRLVKLIGDAVMLVSADSGELIEATLELIDLVEEEGEDFPAVRAGVGVGRVIPRGGDFYGSPVNVASRLTGVARPGSLLVTAAIKEELEDEYRFSFAGHKSLKGIDVPLEVFRCRDLEEETEDAQGATPGEDESASEESDQAEARDAPRRRRRRRRRR